MDIKSYDFYYHLRTFPFVDAIWLYGSRAREDSQSRSDIDLAILCPKATDQNWNDLLRFDALKENDKLRQAILRDKVVLFERKPCSYSWYESFLDLGEAIDRLEEMTNVSEEENSYVRQATIQHFETATELFWKVLKKVCKQEGFEVNSPRAALQKSFELKLIDDEQLWLKMIDDRNLTSHTYNLPLAKEIYYRIKLYVVTMKKAYGVIRQHYDL
jgi:nucleotidyltransferase substrate binding protein (TIGR01987 family)